MKIRNQIAKFYSKTGMVAGSALVSVPAFAEGAGSVDYSGITGAVSWGTVATGITGILAAMVLPKVALRGGRMLLSAIGR
ncbi:hypothetical protein V5738_08845 [Salinisphaera sp. SPP-AMP-43]|uniref:hypothetical protein n=1 Tax=Salinisphaera sp. SPP-AMP-43 TaxID=3121288 RepID=UPI003C6E1531